MLVDDARRLSFAGEQKASLQQLKQALDSREGWVIFVESDPAFDALLVPILNMSSLWYTNCTPAQRRRGK